HEAGCDGVLAKPFEPQLVISRVRELLDQSRGGSAPRTPATPLKVVPAPAPPEEPAMTAGPDHAAEEGGSAESLGDFFDKLDAAVANLPGARRETMPYEGGHGPLSDDDLPSFLSPPNEVEPSRPPRPAMRQAPPAFWSAQQPAPAPAGAA